MFITKEDQAQIERKNMIAASVATFLILCGIGYFFTITTYVEHFFDNSMSYQIFICVPAFCCYTGALMIIVFEIE